jgi:hypothetical protein
MAKQQTSDFPLDGAAPLSPDPEQDLVDGEQSDAEKAIERLQIVSAGLASRRNEWITSRAAQGHDQRWSEDVAQYNGRDYTARLGSQMMDSVQQGYPVTQHGATQTRSTVFVQVTRQKTNAMAARLADVVLPSDDRNFSIAPTPIPSLPSFVTVPPNQYDTKPDGVPLVPPAAPTGPAAVQTSGPSAAAAAPAGAPPMGGPQPATPAAPAPAGAPGGAAPTPQPTAIDQATQKMLAEYTEAKRRSDLMQLEIEDCLEEADYNAEARKGIFDMALLGTVVMKGPVVVNRTRRAWKKAVDLSAQASWNLEVMVELKPASFRIDPRCFFPDPLCGEDVQNGRGAFEYEKRTAKQVRDLLKQPGYIKSQVVKVLEEGPQVGKAQVALGELEDRDLVPGEVYEHWTYWGEIDLDTLKAAGLVPPEGDESDVLSACVEMINSTIVRAYFNPMPDGSLPYDMAPLERVPGSVWGYGVPMLLRAQQRVINAAWRMILDNAGVSSGPQIVVKAQSIKPADHQWTLTSRKIWYANEDVEDVNKAFGVFEFPSRQAELQNIIEMADKLSDQETAVPMIAQAQQGAAPATVGGMQMLMQSANTMLKRLVKVFDDYITKPHMRRYYTYLMEFSPNENIKGDFNVIALGSSALVVRDIQNQAMQQMLTVATNPAFAPLINLKKLYEKTLKAQHIDPVDVMNTDAEILQNMQNAAQNQQPDPRVIAAEARAKADEDRTAAQVKMNEETLANKHDIAMQDLQFRRDNLEIERQIEMLKLANKEKVSLESIRASLAAVSIKVRSEQDMHATDKHVELATGGDPQQKSWE